MHYVNFSLKAAKAAFQMPLGLFIANLEMSLMRSDVPAGMHHSTVPTSAH
jgi:hypothetical protein